MDIKWETLEDTTSQKVRNFERRKMGIIRTDRPLQWAKRVRSLEPAVIAAFCVVSGGAFLYVRIAGEVLEGETSKFDSAILVALRQPGDIDTPIGPVWLTRLFTDLTSLGGTTVLCLISFLAIVYLFIIARRNDAVFLFLSVLGGWLISHFTKLGLARPRPDLVAHLVEVNDFSFPSGHAMVSAVTYLTLGLLLAGNQTIQGARYYFVAVALLLTLLIGVSRVYLGVHYPTDVLGGWSAGAAWACGCWLVRRWLVSRSVPSAVD